MLELSRRRLLATSALAVAGLPLASRVATAAAPSAGQQAAAIYRYKIGAYELTAMYDGIWIRPIDEKFVRNAAFSDVQKALAESFMPADKLLIPFTTLLVNTGSKLVLIDTGTGGQMAATAGSMMGNLAAAGVRPETIDTVLISHFHPDHINGLVDKEGRRVFTNAEIKVSAPEWAYWMDEAKLSTAAEGIKGVFLNAHRVFTNIKDVTRFEPGSEVAPGITSIAAYGHTPGHVAFNVASGSQSMMVLSDTTNHPWLFARHPEWQPAFDMDGPMAVENRKRLLDRVAADKMLVQGYHFPFPASGHIVKTAGGYEHVPVMWEPAL
jgi:glyoxylase-like metal-dependent hydrolase (beta-lactamase superfamily II)